MRNPREIVLKAINYKDKLSVAKALSLIEEGLYEEFSDIIFKDPEAHIIGITGSPGVGKSTLINALITEIRKRNKSVAVIAIDPSSPISGGAFLGNRVRVRALDDVTFYRSISTPPERSLPLHAYLMLELLNAVGYDYIIIETPGAGQVNVDVANIADTVVVVVQPLTGDDIQVLKSGIMEIGDIYVVNKADLPQADITLLQLKSILQNYVRNGGWQVRILKVSSLRHNGIKELLDTINEHRIHLERTNKIKEKLIIRRTSIIREYINTHLQHMIREVLNDIKQGIDPLENPLKYAKQVLSKVLERICSLNISEGGSTAH